MITLNALNLSLKNSDRILCDVQLDIQSGEFVYVTGRSGAGKSSLLKLLHGDLAFTGDFSFQGQEVQFEHLAYLRAFQQQVKYVSQDLLFDASKTVFENLVIYDNFKGLPSEVSADKVAHLLRDFSLSHVARHFPDELSGGEQARLALAMMLTTEPSILLLDEPTANLDPKMSDQVLDLLEQMNARGVTIILATHDAHILKKFPHRQVVVREGKLYEQSGSESQANLLAKKFVSDPMCARVSKDTELSSHFQYRELRIAWHYTLRHFKLLFMSLLPMFLALILLNLFLSMLANFPRIFGQLTIFEQEEQASNSFFQGVQTVQMLRYFNLVLFMVCLGLVLTTLIFLWAHTRTVMRQLTLLEQSSLQARYQLVLDEKAVYREFFLSAFFILLVGAPLNYLLSLGLETLVLGRIMTFYELEHLSLLPVLGIPLVTGLLYTGIIYQLMRQFARKFGRK